MTNPPAEPGAALPPHDPEVFPPTLREVMLRPQWIAMLLLCLVVAGVFAWLGQWQLSRAIDTDPPPPGMTEQVRPLAEITAPGQYLSGPYVGQRVEVSGWWIGPDFLVVHDRVNAGVEGFWVTGQLRMWDAGAPFGSAEPVSLAVALGWAPTLAQAQAAASDLRAFVETTDVAAPAELVGRIISDEGPVVPPADGDPFVMTRMSPAMLLGQWHDTEGLDMYRSYLVADDVAGLSEVAPQLDAIVAAPPSEESPVNWLNIFYAVEWAIFAGFAFYLWYRLARDAWEKELEDLEDAAAEA